MFLCKRNITGWQQDDTAPVDTPQGGLSAEHPGRRLHAFKWLCIQNMALHQRRVYLLSSLCNLSSVTQAIPTHLLLGTSFTHHLLPPSLYPFQPPILWGFLP